MKTFSPKSEDLSAAWHLIDATDVVLGKLAVASATLLRGKHKSIFAPHVNTGDCVIIINAEKVALTGQKAEQKRLWMHSGFPGGISSRTYRELLETNPVRIIEEAVKGMIPKTTLGRKQLNNLRVYARGKHPHEAQNPKPFNVNTRPKQGA
ncbi:MAG: 50S ribosomal protein L13 [Candidatus Ancillula trichonymphae]|jgi:large subunit ribosomal protein L13|nr:50S ribosomal protein L13 [Candidatus Ancillula trichonymphae]